MSKDTIKKPKINIDKIIKNKIISAFNKKNLIKKASLANKLKKLI